jgi:hypothetical protein
MIKMKNLLNQNAWYWDDVKFVNRSFIIKVKINNLLVFFIDKRIFFLNILGTLSKIFRWRRRHFIYCKRR